MPAELLPRTAVAVAAPDEKTTVGVTVKPAPDPKIITAVTPHVNDAVAPVPEPDVCTWATGFVGVAPDVIAPEF